MQSRLLNYSLFLLSPHFGMILLLFLMDGFAVVPLMVLGGIFVYFFIGLGIYYIGFRLLQRWIATLGLQPKNQRIVLTCLILLIVLCSYINIFALLGFLPALVTAFFSDYFRKRLHLNPPHISLIPAKIDPLRSLIWLVAIVLVGFMSAALLGFLDEKFDISLFMLMGAVGGLSAFIIGCVIILLQLSRAALPDRA